jgi:hypothetical protein
MGDIHSLKTCGKKGDPIGYPALGILQKGGHPISKTLLLFCINDESL